MTLIEHLTALADRLVLLDEEADATIVRAHVAHLQEVDEPGGPKDLIPLMVDLDLIQSDCEATREVLKRHLARLDMTRTAYEAYCEAGHLVSVPRELLLDWDDLDEQVQNCWIKAATAVKTFVLQSIFEEPASGVHSGQST